ncbi:signal peptidase II [Micromonospora sp. NPDC049366]|uniref:signal peptidase II n=1 Tax=Micromonospora sp. NPDC049366 TaxID=3364271 RepID=UPI0037A19880
MSAAPTAGSGRTEQGDRRPRPRAVAILAGTAVVALVADAVTKHLALEALTDREPVRLLGGAIYLNLVRNSGAAWSIGSDYTWVFPLITIGVIGWILWMALRLRSLPWAVSLGLVLGGALGNLADRIFRAPAPFHGHVVDMISVFGPFGEYFPVFNLADSSLVCGVILALLLELTGRQRDGGRVGRDGRPLQDPADGSAAEQRERA